MIADIKKQNKTALILIIAAVVITAILFSLPAYEFTTGIYTKKSGNTFVGDEKYYSVLEEVNAIADDYRAQGFDVDVSEEVTERVNSKGETTSMVAFSVNQTYSKNTWSFLKAGFNSSYVLIAMTVLFALATVFAITGSIKSQDVQYKFLSKEDKRKRSSAIVFFLIGMLLIPVFVMMNTYTFSRQVGLYNQELITEGKEVLFSKLDIFLLGGSAGEKAQEILGKLTFHSTVYYWLSFLCIFAAMLGAIELRFGAIKHTLLRGLLYAFVIVVCVITLYPYYVMLITGLRSNAETTDMYFLHMFPTKWIWSNIKDIIDRNVLVYLKNSLIVAGGATVIAMICGIPAAYSMARRKFKGKKVFLGFVIMSQMFAPVVLLIGIAQLMSKLNLNDSLFGLVLINAAFNQAFAIWLLRGTFVSISSEMEQAALIDGCTPFQSMIKVLIPMAAPGIVTALIFVFINAWNEYTVATILITNAVNKPITVGITTFSSFNMIEWQYLFAASVLATIPVVILFTIIEKHLVSGLTSGGVKG